MYNIQKIWVENFEFPCPVKVNEFQILHNFYFVTFLTLYKIYKLGQSITNINRYIEVNLYSGFHTEDGFHILTLWNSRIEPIRNVKIPDLYNNGG